jgi:RND family efflux transporter MFP subunit
MKIANQQSARAIIFVVLVALTSAARGHEGHAPLPTKGAEVNVEEGLVTLSDGARASLGVETGEVALRPLQQTVLAYATVLLDWQQLRFITTPIAGRISKLYVKPGETVAAGQKLAEIDSMELANLQLQLLDAQAVAELSARTQDRLQALAREQVIAGRELAEAEAAHSQNVMAVEIAKSKLRRLRLTDEQIESILVKREPIRTLAILSPIAGVAIHTDLALGKFVEPTEHLFEVMDLSSVSVRIDVLEQDLGKVKAGQAVELSVTGLPNEVFKGAIKTEEAFIDSDTHLGRAWMVLPNAKDAGRKLLPGMYGQATVAISSPDPRLTVPASAVLNNGTEWFVLVEEAATARASEYRKRNVAVGLKADGLAEITAGDVYPGDRVVTTGGHEMANFLEEFERFGNPVFRRGLLLCLIKSRGTEMLGSNNDLRSRRIVVMFFAVLSGVSAAAVAVLPAVHA